MNAVLSLSYAQEETWARQDGHRQGAIGIADNFGTSHVGVTTLENYYLKIACTNLI